MVAGRRDQRGAPALEEEQVGEEADQLEQGQGDEGAGEADAEASPEIHKLRGVMVKSPSFSANAGGAGRILLYSFLKFPQAVSARSSNSARSA